MWVVIKLCYVIWISLIWNIWECRIYFVDIKIGFFFILFFGMGYLNNNFDYFFIFMYKYVGLVLVDMI